MWIDAMREPQFSKLRTLRSMLLPVGGPEVAPVVGTFLSKLTVTLASRVRDESLEVKTQRPGSHSRRR